MRLKTGKRPAKDPKWGKSGSNSDANERRALEISPSETSSGRSTLVVGFFRASLALEHVATVGPEPVDFGLPPDWSTEELAHVSAQNLSFVESIFSQNPSLRVLFSKGDTGKLTSVEK